MVADHDIVFVEDLSVEMSIGIYEHEKSAKQHVLVSAEAQTKPNTAHGSDDIADALSYEDMVNVIVHLAGARHYELVESFAEDIASAILLQSAVEVLKVTVKKPDIFKDARSVGITILRCAK